MLSRKPDLVLFCTPRNEGRPCWKGGVEMVSNPLFKSGYRLAVFEPTQPFPMRSLIWVRAEDGPLAITREPGRVVVPGFYLSSREAPARLEKGRLVTVMRGGQAARLGQLELEAGRYRLRVEASGAKPTVSVQTGRAGAGVERGTGEVTFTHVTDRARGIDVTIDSPAKEGVQIERVVIERLPPE